MCVYMCLLQWTVRQSKTLITPVLCTLMLILKGRGGLILVEGFITTYEKLINVSLQFVNILFCHG